jgi:TonB-linked SusC/RagA family outer membrane protein
MRWTRLAWLPLLLLPFSDAWAQQAGTIMGRVTDQAGVPLSGVEVAVDGTGLSALSDENGRYQITRVPAGSAVVRVTRLGYTPVEQTVTVEASGTTTVDLTLAVGAIELEGLVAVGYGTQKKVNLTGAVASVQVEQMEKLPVPTITHALQGLSPGLQVLDGGHQPGRYATDLLIRGQGTLGRTDNRGDRAASRPLVLIDGIEGNMNTLAIDDVENISVLKDASSAAIYGSRAANGVILITTKRGVARDRPQITYSGYVGVQNITAWPERVDAVTHMELRNVARQNMRNWCTTTGGCNPADFADTYSQEYIEATARGDDPVNFPQTNWVDLMFDPAPIQDHTLRVSGGRETARYALSLDYMQEDGLMPTTGAKRYGVRLNTDFQASQRISAGLDLAANRRWDVVPALNWNSTFYLIHDTPPTRAAQFPDGTYGLNLFNLNPIAYARESGNEERTFNQGTVTGRLNYDLVPGWAELQTLGSVRYDNNDWERFLTDSRYVESWPSNGAPWGPNRLEHRNSANLQSTLRALLNYGHSFGAAHDWSGVVGFEQIANNYDEFRAWREDFFNNDLRRLNLGNADTRGNWGAGSEWGLRSLFGRMNYSYRSRYLFEVNARYDGSSRFAEGRRFGLFPSFSAGWRISEEPFFNVGWIDELKLRGSWGQLGNQDVPLYSYYSSISVSQPYWFGGQVHDGAAATSLANEELSWETTTVTDFGFDAGFLQGRLSFSGDVYNRRTEDILLNVPIPAMVGRSAPFINAGVVQNKGWELSLGWRDAFRTLNYGIDVNLSDNRNKVLDLYGTGPYIRDESVVLVGAPINSWYGFEATGLFQSQAEIDSHAQPSGWITRPGDIKYKDQNGDGVVNEDDRVVIGDPNPRYIFGVNLNASWRNFDAGMFFQGVGKRDQYLALGFIQGPVWENYTSKWHLDYWTPENPDARHPAYYANYNRNYYATNSWWILDGSFVKLRNVQLGYNVPSQFAQRVGVDRLRFYVTGKNLWTRSKLGIDLDPEYPWVRADYYPQTKVFSIGTDISF